MKVKELIAELSKLDDQELFVMYESERYDVHVDEVVLRDDLRVLLR